MKNPWRNVNKVLPQEQSAKVEFILEVHCEGEYILTENTHSFKPNEDFTPTSAITKWRYIKSKKEKKA